MRYDPALEGRDHLTERIIGAAMEVHRHLGAGLLESTYEECLCLELRTAGMEFERQQIVSILYKGSSIPARYRPDLVVEKKVVVEIKAVEMLAHVHEAQLLTYMKHTGIRTGLLLNFNTGLLKRGLRRYSL
jgi:GxxExxY protein